MTIEQTGSNIVVKGNLNSLNSFNSTDPNQGLAKWIGIDINTGIDDITKLQWNGSQLSDADVAEAASVGLGAGHIIFWAKADSIALSPRQITLSGEGFESVTFSVSFEEA